jgi:hypothetical protein
MAVVSMAWALMVMVDAVVAEPAGTAESPVSWIFIETLALVAVAVGVPESGQVGGVIEEIGPTVNPRLANVTGPASTQL